VTGLLVVGLACGNSDHCCVAGAVAVASIMRVDRECARRTGDYEGGSRGGGGCGGG